MLVLDEARNILQIPAGQTFVRETVEGSRKFNTRVVIAGHNTSDMMLAGIENLIDNAFVGRTEGLDEQESALRTLHVPTGVGYESVLGGLSPRERQSEFRTGFREFVVDDGDGGKEKVYIEIPEKLKPYTDTTASQQNRRNILELVQDPIAVSE